eukprot:3653451-Amphidinium_carterae.1
MAQSFEGQLAVVRLLGDSGVSLAAGLYAYLKEDMQFIVTWEVASTLYPVQSEVISTYKVSSATLERTSSSNGVR